MLKSPTLTVIVTEPDREPLVPVTVTVYMPRAVVEVVMTVRVEVAEVPRLTLVGPRDSVRPAEEATAERETIPVKPPNPVTVTVEVSEEPTSTESVEGLTDILKPTTRTVTVTE